MRSQIVFGSTPIEFNLSYSERKTLGITVTPGFEVLVTAPFTADLDTIHEKLRKKAPWIIRQKGYFLTFHPRTPAKKYLTGETHLYRGRQYRLLVQDNCDESVRIKGSFLMVNTTDPKRIKTLVTNWYEEKANLHFHKIARPHIDQFKKYNVEPSDLVLRQMSLRWGSCTAKGKIILNPELIKAPNGCIEYVIVHELCHLLHRDHTRKFIELQTKEMPDWERWKTKLEHLLA